MPVNVDQYELVHKPITEMKAFKRNSRKHPEKQIKLLVKNITELGFTNPMLIEPDGSIIAGHGRLLAAKRLEMKTIPCIILAGLSEAEKRGLVIADNKIAELATWDEEKLKEELGELGSMDLDLDLSGFDFKDMGDLDPKLVPSDIERTSEYAEKGQESIRQEMDKDRPLIDVTVRMDDVQFPATSNKLGIPDLKPAMLGTDLPIVPRNRKDGDANDPRECVFTWGEHRRSICTPDHTRGATLCFYEEDDAFSGIFDKPAETVDKMKEYEWGQVVSPEFTIYRDMPLVLMQYIYYKTMYMTRYFQEAGFKVVPMIHLFDEKDDRHQGLWYWSGIPKGCPVVSAQINTVYGRMASKDSYEERGMFFREMERMVAELQPQNDLLYGSNGQNDDHLRENLPSGPQYSIVAGISSLHRAKNTKSGNW